MIRVVLLLLLLLLLLQLSVISIEDDPRRRMFVAAPPHSSCRDSCVIPGLTFETFNALGEQLRINVLGSGVKIVRTEESKVGVFHFVISSFRNDDDDDDDEEEEEEGVGSLVGRLSRGKGEKKEKPD